MKRRSFLASLLAIVAAPFVPTPVSEPKPQLAFHPDAFKCATDGLDAPMRFDVIYGLKTVSPDFACRIVG